MSSGRPCDGIWQHFKQRTDLGPDKAECDSCGHVMTGNAQRLKTHYEKHEYGSLDPTARKEGPSASKQPKISDFVAFTNKTQQRKFEKCVGEFFFANNIPFVAVESGQFCSGGIRTIRSKRFARSCIQVTAQNLAKNSLTKF